MPMHMNGGGGGINFHAMLKHGGWQKGGESYVFFFDDCEESRLKLLEVLGDFEADRELSFNMADMAFVAGLVEKRGQRQALAAETLVGLSEARAEFFETLNQLTGGDQSVSE